MVYAKVIWLQSFLKELKFVEPHKPILFTDSIIAKYIASNPMMHARMKHVEIDFYFIRDLIINDKLDIRFILSVEQVANVLTNLYVKLYFYL